MNFNFTLPLWLGIILCCIYIIDKIVSIIGRKNIKTLFYKLFILLFYKNNEDYYKLKIKFKYANKKSKAQQEIKKQQEESVKKKFDKLNKNS